MACTHDPKISLDKTVPVPQDKEWRHIAPCRLSCERREGEKEEGEREKRRKSEGEREEERERKRERGGGAREIEREK